MFSVLTHNRFRFSVCLFLAFFFVCHLDSHSLYAAEPVPTLQKVRQDKRLKCGVFSLTPSQSAINSRKGWQGFYVDFCKAVAAAVLKNPKAVSFVELDEASQYNALQERIVDVVMQASLWTLTNESKHSVNFPAVYLFDGQSFLVQGNSRIRNLADLQGKTICVQKNGNTDVTLRAFIQKRAYEVNLFYSDIEHFFSGGCDAYSSSRISLASTLAERRLSNSGYRLLSDNISRNPLGPMVLNSDYAWSRLIRAVIHATVIAESRGITQANVVLHKLQNKDPQVSFLLGSSGSLGAQLDLDGEWAYRVIRAVGNYGEIYNRHFGGDSPVGADRGDNKPWSIGGLLYTPVFR